MLPVTLNAKGVSVASVERCCSKLPWLFHSETCTIWPSHDDRSTDNAPAGALYMLTFGLATVPVTLAISLSGRLLPMAWRLRLRHLVPVTVGVVGTLLVLRGLSLGIPYLSPDMSGGGPNCCVAR